MKNTRWIAMLLTLCMVIGLMPTVAQAAPVLEKKAADSWTVMGSVDAQTLLDAGDEVYGEAEPNDDVDSANLIYHDYTISGTLSGDDIDCYVFELTKTSTVTVLSACTTDGLVYGLFDYYSGELLLECEYLGQDEESGLHMDGFSAEVPAGIYCLVFLEYYEDDAEYAFYIEILGNETHYHDYGDGVVTKAPTCTENGVMTYTCSCGDYYTEEILADGHNFSGGKCTVCGASGDEVIATGKHNGGTISWELTAEGGLTLSGSGSMVNMDEYEWDIYADMITSVVIGDGITNISEGAFMEFHSLKSVDIGNAVTIIDRYAFAGSYELKEITIPASVTEIRYGAFWLCTGLSEITFESGSQLKVIGQAAFSESGLTAITLPDTVQTIEDAAFVYNYYLTEVVIPASVKSFGGRVFTYCENLERIQFLGDAPAFAANSFEGLTCEVVCPANNATWTEEVRQNYGGTITWTGYSIDPDSTGSCGTNLTWELYRNSGLLVISGTGTMNNFDYNSGLWAQEREWITSVVVNEGVTSIGEFAFYNLENLVSVSLPNSLQVIGEAAFSCTGITEINIPASVIQMYTNAFESCFALERIIVAEGNKYYCNDSQGILYEKDMKTLLFCPQGFAGVCTIPEGVEKIAKLAFHYCDKLTAVQMANTVTTIGESAFQGCYGLEQVVLSEKLEVIGKAAFADCSMLSEMTFPESVTEIGEGAFSCAGLTEITFKGAAPVIGDYAFEGVTANVHYPMNKENWTPDKTVNYGGSLKWIREVYYRISGAGRSETAIEAANELKEVLGIEKFDTIILASGEGFADALAGSYLAVKKDAPILLVRKTTIELNKNYILDNLTEGGTVYILGGTAAVPQEMEDALEGLNVVRIKGEDRFDTNLKILEEAGIKNEEILICTGWNFADSLSASATGLPILMLNTTKDALTADQEAFLAKYADNKFTVIGGTAAVSDKLEADVEAIVGEADRVYGGTREETSVKIAQRYFSVPDYVLVAYSRNFPDGLCGGPLAHALKAPLLLVNAGVETPAAEYIKSQGIPGGAILGGPAAVSEDSARIVFGVK